MKIAKKMLSFVLAMSMLTIMTIAVSAKTASKTGPGDVAENSAFSKAVQFVWERGYMNGYADGTFRAENTVTRAQLFQTLYNIQETPSVSGITPFQDVAPDAWYTSAAAWSKGTGLTEGTSAGFSANTKLNRQQLVKVMCAYAELTGETLQGGDLSAYKDVEQVASYALPYMKMAVGSGIINGSGDKLNPAGAVTRGQLAQILYNYFSKAEAAYTSAKRPLLLEGAMGIETTTMIEALTNPVEYTLGQYDYVAGTYHSYPVVVCRTEQGQANAAASTALAMEFFNPVAVINQGTSGGHDPALHTYDIVIGKQSFDGSAWKSGASAKGTGVDYKDIEMQGVYAYGKTAGEFTQQVYYDADATLLAAANTVKGTYTQGSVVNGIIDSCDAWNNQVDRMLYLYETFGSSCEEMETNAVAQICKTYDIPFLGIRILSNTGIYGENFDWKTGAACQSYVLNVAKQYITSYLSSAPSSVTANNQKTSLNTQSYDKTQRPILLEGAMGIETTTMISALNNPTAYKLGQWDYVAGTYNGYPVVVCRTEQGLANTGASTALAMEFFNPSAVIDQGTSGGHDPALHTYDIVLGKRTVNYSAWKTIASAKGAGVDYTAFEMNGVYAYDREEAAFTQSVYHDADPALLKAASTVKDSYTDGSVVEGTIGTSNEWNNQIDRMLYLNKTVGTSCEEMETDAAAQICKTYHVPYLGVRILSNTGIYGENFDWKTGAACQNYVLSVAAEYISSNLK